MKFAEEHATDATAILGLIRIIDASEPSILYSENVTQARDSATYILLKAMLKVCGYSITESSEAELDSGFTHSIENRKRWWFIAVSNGLKNANLLNFPKFKEQHNQLSDILDEVPNTSNSWRDTETKKQRSEKNKLNGKNFGFNVVNEHATKIGVCGKRVSKR
ncbi:DNA cytosine methyltransferase [Psychromonas sp. KJ10-2]|uniref:DNA cytosine methyltransferase n=1 Tax=Psychromonas sp. KJ10-2 TaxID=3391822 RepID=UPI0039B43D8C